MSFYSGYFGLKFYQLEYFHLWFPIFPILLHCPFCAIVWFLFLDNIELIFNLIWDFLFLSVGVYSIYIYHYDYAI
jgi:hypothetical protein